MTEIKLSDNSVIKDAELVLEKYCSNNWGLDYDNPVNLDGLLTAEEIRLANRLYARMSPKIIDSILRKRNAIHSILKQIPNDLTLWGNDPINWDLIQKLFEELLIPQIRAARATKVIHKKRPNLIPILDSAVSNYAWSCLDKQQRSLREPELMVKYCKLLKQDIVLNKDNLEYLKQAVPSAANLSLVRILDILVWMQSYEKNRNSAHLT